MKIYDFMQVKSNITDICIRQFLINFKHIIRDYKAGIKGEDLLSVMEKSMTIKVEDDIDYDDFIEAPTLYECDSCFELLENVLRFQIIDLKDVEEIDLMSFEYSYFGIVSTKGTNGTIYP